MHATFSLPPELERSAPRDVGLTMGGRALMVLAWLLVAGAVAAGVALYLEAQRQSAAAQDFDQRSVTVSAVVDRLWRKSGDGKPAHVAFHFDANGVRIAFPTVQVAAGEEASAAAVAQQGLELIQPTPVA